MSARMFCLNRFILEEKEVHNWKKTIVSPDTLLIDVLAVIDREALRIALVVDDEGLLIGTLTDGDVRRAILKHGNLQVRADTVMNKKPIIVRETMSTIEMGAILRDKDILAVPIVNDLNRLVGLYTLKALQQQKTKENPVFIMAGGFGTRLRPLTDNCPKPMLKIGGRPILETILESFLDAGFKNFYFSVHYLPDVIKDYFGDGRKFGCSIQYVYEDSPLGTGGALGLLPEDLPDLPLIMINGDVLSKVDLDHLLEYHNEKKPVATICVRTYEYEVPYGVIEGDGSRILSMVEKPKQSFFINAGIYVVEKYFIKSVPKNVKIDMPTLLGRYIADNKHVSMFPVHEYWVDVGKMNDFEQAQDDIKEVFHGK